MAAPAPPQPPKALTRERGGLADPLDTIPVRDSLAERAAVPLTGPFRVVVGGFGGGSGRTTVTAGLGMALAAARYDPVARSTSAPAATARSPPAPR
ncbi:MAG TPA: hypothetical protein VKP11_12230 [Frankiaceae bacterium]|nr:hypothetical protein [Frankiaceae bacterium]